MNNNEVTRQILGIVGMSYKNDYSASVEYKRGNVVVYDGSSYVAKKTTRGNLPTNSEYFQLIARKPIKGTDYFTEEDIDMMVERVTEDAESEFNRNVVEKTNEFNSNATSKTSAFDLNAEQKTTTFNNNASSKTSEFNTNATNKTSAYNSNAESKVSDFNTNASAKTTSFDTNASDKTTAFNSNATSKTNDYDTNASTKLEAYNTNHTTKLNEYNTNHTSKMSEYNTNAENKVEEFDEHVDELEERVEVLETVIDGLPKVEGEGTDIQLKNTIKSPLKMKLDPSELEQVTTTGRNLFNSKISNTTASGATVTYDESTQEITIDGTCTAQTDIIFVNVSNIVLSEPTTLYSKIVHVSGSGGNMRFEAYTSSYGSGLLVTANDISSDVSESTTRSNTTYSIFRLRIYAGTFNNHKFKFYMSTVNDTYEPYTGGIASPNPDYPQEVKRIWGDNELKVENKNLFNALDSTWSKYNNGISLVSQNVNNSVIVGIAAWGTRSYSIKNIKKNTNFTISCKFTSALNRTVGLSVYGSNIKTATSSLVTTISSKTEQLIANKTLEMSNSFNSGDYEYILIRFFNNASATTLSDSVNLYIDDVQLEINPNKTDFIEHEEQLLPLNLGVKNYLSIGTQLNGYRNSSTGTFQRDLSSIGYYFKTTDLPNQITFNCTSGNRANISYYNEIPETTVIAQDYSNSNTLPRTINVNKNYQYVHIQFSYNEVNISNIQIQEGDHIQESSDNPIEYCAIGDYSDEFFYNSSKREDYIDTLENNKWYLKKNTGKVVLDGSESWAESSTNASGIKRMSTNKIKNKVMPIDVNKIALIMCTHYKKESAADTYRKNVGIGIDNTGILFIYDSNYNTSESLTSYKVWLAENNIIVYYILATPEYVLLNDTLQKQLTDIAKVLSYDEETNISQENEELPFQISASTLRDINSMFESLETRIAELETA